MGLALQVIFWAWLFTFFSKMKPKNLIHIIKLAILLNILITTACAVGEPSPPIKFDDGYLNQQILLSAPVSFNRFSAKDAISVEITNASSHDIVFQNNYGILMFLKSNDGWVEVAEVPTTRLPEGEVLLSPKATKTTYIMPNLPRGASTYSLRIYVFGTTKGDKEFGVAAFTDLVLSP